MAFPSTPELRGGERFRFHCGDRVRLLDRTAGQTVRDIRAREFECSPAIIAATGVELRAMVREGEQMFRKQLLESDAGCIELCLGLGKSPLRGPNVGKTPRDLRIATRKRR